ncbi:urease accessory protein UreD [Paenibacillus hamazuiensis]|uniref:urease accessory protein UreD n=1 Tax=Paenibacillus hamazuiensis TaxID=2936508 RepID=UPI00200BF90F|nr:urease accessory protein UreD [Paenibacillus hamazuiensis]
MPDVTGIIDAVFEKAGGRTRLSRKFHRYPLKIAKTFPFELGQLGVYMMDASPGMMAGDRYELIWRLEEDAHVLLTNQSYTKVHPSRKNEQDPIRPSSQKQSIAMASGSVLEYIPEPVMLYKDANLITETQVRMEAGSVLFLSDIVCPGRTFRGEVFQYESCRSKLEVSCAGELIFSSRQKFEPARMRMDAVGVFGEHTHIGSFYAFMEGFREDHAERLREKLDAHLHKPLPGGKTIDYGVSLGSKHSLIVQALARSVMDIQLLFETVWAELRFMLLGLPPAVVNK